MALKNQIESYYSDAENRMQDHYLKRKLVKNLKEYGLKLSDSILSLEEHYGNFDLLMLQYENDLIVDTEANVIKQWIQKIQNEYPMQKECEFYNLPADKIAFYCLQEWYDPTIYSLRNWIYNWVEEPTGDHDNYTFYPYKVNEICELFAMGAAKFKLLSELYRRNFYIMAENIKIKWEGNLSQFLQLFRGLYDSHYFNRSVEQKKFVGQLLEHFDVRKKNGVIPGHMYASKQFNRNDLHGFHGFQVAFPPVISSKKKTK